VSLTATSQRATCGLPLRTAYLVAALGVSDVLRVRHKLGEPLLRLFLRGIGDVPEVGRNVSASLPAAIIDGI
jgi:hypothetical protein